jgi:hypothetical protein
MCIGLHVQYLLFWSDFGDCWIFSTYFRKTLKCKFSWKSIQCGDELFHAEVRTGGRTDKHTYKDNSCCWKFCERVSYGPKYSIATFDPIRRKRVQIKQSYSDRLTELNVLHFQNFTKESSDSHCYIAVMQSFSTFSQTFFFQNVFPVICNF